jgi:hypothetical protein
MSAVAPFIPFVRSGTDEALARESYNDAPFWRVTLEREKTIKNVPAGCPLWIDLAFDGTLHAFEKSDKDWVKDWAKFVNRHGDLSCLADEAFLAKPDRNVLDKPIRAALAQADQYQPALISIPQLPYLDGVGHNKVNKTLFQITTDWHQSSHSKAKLILPVIFTHCRQLNKKTDRNPKVKFVAALLTSSSVNAVWSVDSSLEDQSGAGNLARERFPGVIDFFKELKATTHLETTVAGPYWGLGLLLWTRGLVTHFGIGIGSTYRYHVPGGMAHAPKTRIAPECLRRWISSSADLRDWLLESAAKLPNGSPEQTELKTLLSHFPALLDPKSSKRQGARAHRNWCQKIAAVATSGRAVALFQDLSTAFVTGKALKALPDDEGPARRPELIAEQLMLNCL